MCCRRPVACIDWRSNSRHHACRTQLASSRNVGRLPYIKRPISVDARPQPDHRDERDDEPDDRDCHLPRRDRHERHPERHDDRRRERKYRRDARDRARGIHHRRLNEQCAGDDEHEERRERLLRFVPTTQMICCVRPTAPTPMTLPARSRADACRRAPSPFFRRIGRARRTACSRRARDTPRHLWPPQPSSPDSRRRRYRQPA